MRVVAGRPDPIAQTPMMNAFIRYVALNPYWNSPPDITARSRLAPNVVDDGRAYLNEKGMSSSDQFGDGAHVLNPMSVDWRAVVAGRVHVTSGRSRGQPNSMGRMKFMFPNAQGIWLHDTPEKEKIEEAARLQSNGCVRLEDAPRFERWLFYGRAPKAQGARPEQKVEFAEPGPDLHHLSDRRAERDVDRLFRRFLRARQDGDEPAVSRALSSSLRASSMYQELTTAGSPRRSCLGASRVRSNYSLELDSELA